MSEATHPHAYEVVSAVVRARRTSLAVDAARVVPPSIVEAICELARCAPNHKRTAPWRFALISGAARERLGTVVSRALHASGETKSRVARAASKYVRAPVVVVVGSAPGDSKLPDDENRDAVAAGIQNMLLAATALGLSSYWSSCPLVAHGDVAQFCGFEPRTHISGA